MKITVKVTWKGTVTVIMKVTLYIKVILYDSYLVLHVCSKTFLIIIGIKKKRSE